jgi:hypothetical protein
VTQRLVDRLALGLVLLAAGVIVLIAGGGFLCAALYLALEGPLGPPLAAALTGLAALLVSIAVLLLGRSALQLPAPPEIPRAALPAPAAVPQQSAQILSALAGEEIGRFLQEKPKSAAGIALVAGLAIGLSPELRGTLGDLLSPAKR